MKDYMADEAVAVLSFDKNTGLIKNVVSCDPENAVSQVKYFRLLGQNARIVRYDDLEFYLERDKKMYHEQNRLMRECGLDFKKQAAPPPVLTRDTLKTLTRSTKNCKRGVVSDPANLSNDNY